MDKVSAYKATIGPINQEYYLSYFKRAEERGYAPVSWHWPVLFLGLFWLLWRRQYRWAIFTALLGFATSVIAGIVQQKTGSRDMGAIATYVLSIPYLGIYLPLKANAIYYEWSKQMVERVQTELAGQPDQQLSWLAKNGGVNNNLASILLIGFGALILLAVLSGPPPT